MEKINVGIIGCGRISDLHYPGYADNNSAQVYAVCDTDQELGARRKKEWGAARYYGDYRELLSDSRIDAVEILTPQLQHEKMVIEAMEAGKHVALQKPMTVDLDSADRMLQAADRAEKLFKVSDNYLFYPPVVQVRKMIEQGEIGTPTNIRIKMISGGSGGWEVPGSSWAWRAAENARGRGFQTFDHGHHLWAVAWYLLGKVERVSAWIDSCDGVIDSPAIIMWKYSDSVAFGSCEYAHASELRIPSKYYANDEWFEVTGTRGVIIIHRCTGNILDGPVVSLFNNRGWKLYEDIPADWKEGFFGSTRNFIDAIRGEARPLLDGQQAREILKFDLAVSKSASVRREVYLDELDAAVPWAYSRNRIREDLKKTRAQRNKAMDSDSCGVIRSVTRSEVECAINSLTETYDRDKAAGWQSIIRISLSWEVDRPLEVELQFADGCLEVRHETSVTEPSLTVRAAAGLWMDILGGRKAIEDAFAGGELILDGNIEDGLKLKEVLNL